MKADQLLARIVAVPLSFPETILIQYQPVDRAGNGLGWHVSVGPYSWEEVVLKFCLDSECVNECERYFAHGRKALIAHPQFVHGEWEIPDGAMGITRQSECA